MKFVTLKIYGMDCVEEVAVLKSKFTSISGVTSLEFDVLNGKIAVAYEEALVNLDNLVEAVKCTGMRAEVYNASSAFEQYGTMWERWRRSILTIFSGLFLVIGFASHSALLGIRVAITDGEFSIPLVAKLFYLGATVLGAWFVLPKAVMSARNLRPDMHLLMMIAVIGAISIGELFEAATVSFLFALSLALESWSVSRARRAIAALMELSPPKARVIENDYNEREVDAGTVAIGTRILVRPGEKIPLDGRVIAGNSSVNQAPITGESRPIDKSSGDDVFAGSINGEGALEIETLKLASESTLSKIIRLVQLAQSKRSANEQWVEKFARYYTPIILVFAVGTAIFPPLLFDSQWQKWFYEALVLLVIACPCALVISTPVSIVSSLVAAAKNGVLIKGGTYVELPAQIRVIALDKTGTLTEGKPVVDTVVPLSGHSKEDFLSIAAAIEKRSEHPLAKAIVQFAAAQGINPRSVENYTALKGKGATAMLNNKSVWVGSHRYLEEQGKETNEMHTILEELSSGGRSVVVVGEEDHVCGFVSLVDKVRPDAKNAIKRLREIGVEKIVMLTGDNAPTARLIGTLVGVDEVRAELLPEEKVGVIEELVEGYHSVAMVGDGINDAPALARSNLGIAMGAAGTDAALETADIALMNDELSRLPWLVMHSRRTLKTIRQNIVASLGVKSFFILLTFMGYASLWMAIAGDMGISLFVVGNALRLLR